MKKTDELAVAGDHGAIKGAPCRIGSLASREKVAPGSTLKDAACQDSEELFINRFENAALGLYRSTVDRLLVANPSLATLFGYDTPQAMISSVGDGSLHDFNNTLSATLMHLGPLRQNPGLSSTTHESLRELEAETMLAAKLTRQFLLFNRHPMVRLEPVDFNRLISEHLKTMSLLLGESIRLTFQEASNVCWVHADPVMLEQFLMNLSLNAREAMPEGGEMVLATNRVDLKELSAGGHPAARPGQFVCVSVTERGHGMDELLVKNLFEPQGATMGTEQETGLGLFGRIIQQHQGWIEAESVDGGGCLFRVFIPAANPQPKTSSPAEDPGAIEGGTETILFVEDDAKVRQPTVLCLRKLGYAVLEASDGPEALKIWDQHQQEISLLFTDMEMPNEITGLELAKRFKKTKQSLKIVLSSGDSVDLTGSLPTLLIGGTYLAKPYSPPTVARIVRRCLDEGKQP